MVPTMPPDLHKISLKIIEAIKQHPVLYSAEVKGPSVKLQEFRQKVWKRISDELGLDPTWVRLRWKNLRDTYCRILKYKNGTEKGVRRKKWIFEDHLSFLKFPYESDYQPQSVVLTEAYVQDISAGGISSECLLEQLEDRNDEDYSEYLEVLEETTADPVETIDSVKDLMKTNVNPDTQRIKSKYRKIRPKRARAEETESLTVYNVPKNPESSSFGYSQSPKRSMGSEDQTNFDQLYLTSKGKDSIELFFDSMAQTVKRLPPKAQSDIKMNICKIVTEAELRYFGQSTWSQSMSQFLSPSETTPKLVLIPCNMIDGQNKALT